MNISCLAHILDYIHLCLYAAKPTSTTLDMALPSLLGNVFAVSPQYVFLWAKQCVLNTEHLSYHIKGSYGIGSFSQHI